MESQDRCDRREQLRKYGWLFEMIIKVIIWLIITVIFR